MCVWLSVNEAIFCPVWRAAMVINYRRTGRVGHRQVNANEASFNKLQLQRREYGVNPPRQICWTVPSDVPESWSWNSTLKSHQVLPGRRQALLQEIQCSRGIVTAAFCFYRPVSSNRIRLADVFRNRPCCPLLMFHVHPRLPSPQPQAGNEQNTPCLRHRSINNILLHWICPTSLYLSSRFGNQRRGSCLSSHEI